MTKLWKVFTCLGAVAALAGAALAIGGLALTPIALWQLYRPGAPEVVVKPKRSVTASEKWLAEQRRVHRFTVEVATVGDEPGLAQGIASFVSTYERVQKVTVINIYSKDLDVEKQLSLADIKAVFASQF